MKFKILLSAVAVVCCSLVYAQPKKVVADKIAAQVGDKIILRSDIYNSIIDAQRQGATLPPDPECVLMERALIDKALVVQAERTRCR